MKGGGRGVKSTDIFAAYNKETYLCDGTVDELAAKFGVSRKYILWSTTPAAVRRRTLEEQFGKRWHSKKKRLVFIRLEDDSDED